MMFYLPIPLFLFLLLLLLPFVCFFLEIETVQVAATRLGFTPSTGLGLLLLMILTSTINIPFYRVESQVGLIEDWLEVYRRQFLGIPFNKVQSTTVVALNVGGGFIPSLLAFYQFRQANPVHILGVVAVVAALSYGTAHVVPGIGIQINPLLAPLTATLLALLVGGNNAAPIAFAGGVLGTLIGANLLHLKDVTAMSSGIFSIGGAGVFDCIVLCGLSAVLVS